MSKRDESDQDRSIKIGKDATGNVIVTGDANVVTIAGGEAPGEQQDRGVPQVFISSTSEDLKQHRAAARDAAIAASFLPIQMEYFVASGQHPPLQACMEKVAEADVVVVIVAHRYGWVPPDQEGDQHKSITWLECEQAHADKKEVLAFVVDEQHAWDDKLKENYRIAAAVSEGKATAELLAEVQRNVQRLADFKAWIDGKGVRATFTTPDNLRAKVSESLRDWKQRHARSHTQHSGKSPAPRQQPAFPSAYREWLQRQCIDIDLVGMRIKDVRPVRLNHVYVPLTTPARHDADLSAVSNGQEESQRRVRSEREPKSELLLSRLNEHSLYVSGPPGSGKSTFCRWVAWLACTGELPGPDEPPADEFREQFPQALRGYLPILVPLRDFWTHLPEDTSEELSLAQFAHSLERWLADKRPGGVTWQLVEPHLDRGTALVIFDGVDEVPLSRGEGNATWYPRSLLLSGLSEAVAAWTTRKDNRLLVTSRPYGLSDAERNKLSLPEARIEELPQPLQDLLAKRWFQILIEDAVGGASLAEDMLTHVRQRPGIDQLASNPMLLTAMCVIYREGKRLPEDKCDLYDRIVDSVLYNRVRDPARIEMVRNELRVVAHGMHTGSAVEQERTSPEAEVDYQEVDQILESYQQQSRWTQAGFEGIVTRREDLLSHTGLLLPRSERRAAFYHFSIQEFLASERLSVAAQEKLVELFRQRSAVPEWHNTLSFLFGTIQRTSVDLSVELVEHLLAGIARDHLGLQVVIGDALQMLLAKKIHPQPDQIEAYRQLCLSAIEREVPLRERNLLGLALGRVGDPRIVTDLRNPAAYVKIPAGEYAYQDGRQTIDKPFALSSYLVTNGQFAIFIKEEGYQNRDLWSEEGWDWQETGNHTEPGFWRNAKWNGPNQPVVGVSWYEAQAFCNWAGGFLPSERQWEAAARGREGREYPWGSEWEDGICNSVEAGLDGTSSVGLFPWSKCRDSDLEDMAGNVWEWCMDKYEDWGRVLRGGSFVSNALHVRSACRNDNDPDDRNSNVGFRVARTYT